MLVREVFISVFRAMGVADVPSPTPATRPCTPAEVIDLVIDVNSVHGVIPSLSARCGDEAQKVLNGVIADWGRRYARAVDGRNTEEAFPSALVVYPSHHVQEYLEFRDGLRELSRRRRADTLQSDMPAAIAAPGSIPALAVAGAKRGSEAIDGTAAAQAAALEKRIASLQLQLSAAAGGGKPPPKTVPVSDSDIYFVDGGARLAVGAMRWDLAPAGLRLCELTSTDHVCPTWHILKAVQGLTAAQMRAGCGTRATCEAADLHPAAQVQGFRPLEFRVDPAGVAAREARAKATEGGKGAKGGKGARQDKGGRGKGAGRPGRALLALGGLAVADARLAARDPRPSLPAGVAPRLCLGPLNEPLDVMVCMKSVVLLRELEKQGAPPGSILMVDIQPPEDASVLFYHGAAQDILYKRRWRRAWVGAPCTHTANSGASSRKGKHLIGLVIAAIAFCVWCFSGPIQAVWFEHSRSCLGAYWTEPDQIVSPDAFGDTFVHPVTGAVHGLRKATEVRMRGFASTQMPIDAAAQAPDPASYASAVISSRHPDGSRLSRAEIAELRARYAPCFMRAVATHTRLENVVQAPHVPYDEAMVAVLAAYTSAHGPRSVPAGWLFDEGRGPPHSAAARELSLALRAHDAGRCSTFSLPASGPEVPPAGGPAAAQAVPSLSEPASGAHACGPPGGGPPLACAHPSRRPSRQ